MTNANSNRRYLNWELINARTPKSLRSLTNEALARKSQLDARTIGKARSDLEKRHNFSTVVAIIDALQVEGDIDELAPHVLPEKVKTSAQVFGVWEPVGEYGSTQTVRGIQFQEVKLQHRLEGRLVRAKRFHLKPLNEQERSNAEEFALPRYWQVLERIGGTRYFARHVTGGFEADLVYWSLEEWEDGRTLRDFSKQAHFEKSEVPRIALEVLLGLKELHAADVIFRDLSPDKVFIREIDRSICLRDFETARIQCVKSTPFRWEHNPYLAPEAINSEVDEKADVFSWANIVLFLLTGNDPAPGDRSALASLKLPKPVFQILKTAIGGRSVRPTLPAALKACERWAKQK